MKRGIISKLISKIGLVLCLIGSIVIVCSTVAILLSPWIYYQPTSYYSAIKNNDVGDVVYIYGFFEYEEYNYEFEEYNEEIFIITMGSDSASFEFSYDNTFVIVETPTIEFDTDISDKLKEAQNHFIIKGRVSEKTVEGEQVKYIKGEEIIKTSQLLLINGYYYPVEDYILLYFYGTLFILLGAILHIGVEHRTLKKMKKENNIIVKEFKRLKRTDNIIRSSIVFIVICLLLIPMPLVLMSWQIDDFNDFDYLDFSGKKEGDKVNYLVQIMDYKSENGKCYVIATRLGSGGGEYRVIQFDKDIRNKIPDNPNKRVIITVRIYDIEKDDDDQDSAKFKGINIEDNDPSTYLLYIFLLIIIIILLLWVWIIFTYKLKKLVQWVIECQNETKNVKFIIES